MCAGTSMAGGKCSGSVLDGNRDQKCVEDHLLLLTACGDSQPEGLAFLDGLSPLHMLDSSPTQPHAVTRCFPMTSLRKYVVYALVVLACAYPAGLSAFLVFCATLPVELATPCWCLPRRPMCGGRAPVWLNLLLGCGSGSEQPAGYLVGARYSFHLVPTMSVDIYPILDDSRL